MHTQTNHDTDSDIQEMLRRDHGRLERLFEELLCAFQGDARTQCEALWTQFDRGMREHFALEEAHILPRFASEHPVEAAALANEHKAILKQLEQLGVGVDLHLTRADVVDELVRTIREHAAREDRLMYAWAKLAAATYARWGSHLMAAIRKLTTPTAATNDTDTFANKNRELSVDLIQKLLIPVDFSPHSERVLTLAAEMCRKHEVAATLLHVWEPEWISVPGSTQLYDPRTLPHGLGHLMEQLEGAKHDLRAAGAMRVDTSLEHGAPATEIVRFASAGKYSLILMGTHGRTGLSHALLGSVAEQVMRHAPCPVMTVHLDGRQDVAPPRVADARRATAR